MLHQKLRRTIKNASQHTHRDVCNLAGKAKTGNLKGEEVGMIDQVAIIGTSDPSLQRANILMRLNRNPVIGDKFSSRHGQKGVLSQLWPDVNMPYVASTGMRYFPLLLAPFGR